MRVRREGMLRRRGGFWIERAGGHSGLMVTTQKGGVKGMLVRLSFLIRREAFRDTDDATEWPR